MFLLTAVSQGRMGLRFLNSGLIAASTVTYRGERLCLSSEDSIPALLRFGDESRPCHYHSEVAMFMYF